MACHDDTCDALSLMQLRAAKRPKLSEAHTEEKDAAVAEAEAQKQEGPPASCVFTSPVSGRSTGTALDRREDVTTLKECQRLCERDPLCRAVEHDSGSGTCILLARMFDGNFVPTPEDADVVVANKMVCGTSALAINGEDDGTEIIAFSETGLGSVQPLGRHAQGVHNRGDGGVATFSGAHDSYIHLKDLPDTFGGPSGFSIAFTSTWAALGCNTHLIDFGSEHGKDSIVVGNVGSTSGFKFSVSRDGVETAVSIKHGIAVNKTSRYLCSVTGSGHMRVFRDGKLLGETAKGQAPAAVTRDLLYIGRPRAKGSMYKGQLSDLCVWNQNVGWEKAKSCISHSTPSLMYSAHVLPTTWSINPALGN